MTEQTYSNLKGNYFIRFYRSVLIISQFDELMIQTLIIKTLEYSLNYENLDVIKTLKNKTGYESKDIRSFIDILTGLEIIDFKNNYITDYIYIINSIKDVIYMVDNRINMKQYSRYQKLSKLKSNILDKQ